MVLRGLGTKKRNPGPSEEKKKERAVDAMRRRFFQRREDLKIRRKDKRDVSSYLENGGKNSPPAHRNKGGGEEFCITWKEVSKGAAAGNGKMKRNQLDEKRGFSEWMDHLRKRKGRFIQSAEENGPSSRRQKRGGGSYKVTGGGGKDGHISRRKAKKTRLAPVRRKRGGQLLR